MTREKNLIYSIWDFESCGCGVNQICGIPSPHKNLKQVHLLQLEAKSAIHITESYVSQLIVT